MKTVDYRTYSKALSKLQREFYNPGPGGSVDIYDCADSVNDEPVRLGVNWSAIGTVSASEARAFAELLMSAAEAAEKFEYNGYMVTYEEG